MANFGLRCALAALVVAATTGCATKHYQRFYFAAASLDDDAPRLKFYRVTVRGEAMNVASNLHTGWYDAETLHELYGQPPTWAERANAVRGGGAGNRMLRYNAATGGWEVVDDNKRFTILYGADASAMAEQVSAMATAQEGGDGIARLIGAIAAGDATIETETNVETAKKMKAAIAELAKGMRTTATQLEAAKTDDKATPKSVRLKLLERAQAVSNALGSVATYDKSDPDKGFDQVQSTLTALSAAGAQ